MLGNVKKTLFFFHLFIYLFIFVYVFCSMIRELATKALHNLTPQVPDYMAATGKQCHPTRSSVNVCLLVQLLNAL